VALATECMVTREPVVDVGCAVLEQGVVVVVVDELEVFLAMRLTMVWYICWS
jgi:hypothetical protein